MQTDNRSIENYFKKIKAMETGLKITIVDDNETFRNSLKVYLTKKLNHKLIAEAISGEDALKIKNIYKSDIIFMDIQMDKLDGFETAKLILQKHSYINIIALSMHKELIYLEKLIKFGFKAFVDKRDYFSILPGVIESVMKGEYIFPDNVKL